MGEKTQGDTLEKEQVKQPRRYSVVLHNDDFTTQEFVTHILINFFYKDQENAHRIMMKVHLEGKASVGLYPKDIALSKVAVVTSYARQNGMPLLLTVHPE